MNVVTHTTGAAEMLITLENYPAAALAEFIESITNVSPCLIPTEETICSLVGQPPEAPVRRRVLKGPKQDDADLDLADSGYSGGFTQSVKDLNDELRRIRETYDFYGFSEFFKCFREWRMDFGRFYKDDYNWRDAVLDCYCAVDITQPECQPELNAKVANWLDTLTNLGIYSLFGPLHNEQTDAVCAALGDDDPLCCFFASANANLLGGWSETSLLQLFHYMQMGLLQQFVNYNPLFNSIGWFTDPTPLSVFPLLPIFNEFILDNPVCDVMVNSRAMSPAISLDALTYYASMLW